MKPVHVIGLVCALTVVTAGQSLAGPRTVVYPTGTHPTDAVNVQSAVDGGGTVLLKATDVQGKPRSFNFGPAEFGSGSVNLPAEVTVLGETRKQSMTTISGGSIPFFGIDVSQIAIRGIHFDGPSLIAIDIIQSTDAEIELTGNLVTNVVGAEFGDLTFGWGFEISEVSGEVLVADNVIDQVHALVGYGMTVAGTDAEITIRNNRVSGINLNGILVGFNVQEARIVDNVVIPGPEQDPFFTAGNGILLGHAQGGTFYVAGNRVICENPQADGIVFVSRDDAPVNGALVEENHVTMHGSLYGGITMYDTSSFVVVRDNKVDGDGAFALQISGFDPETAVSNVLEANNLKKFDSSVADILIDINGLNTMLVHQRGSLIDNGTGTEIVD